jgi:hypothetical protein
MPPNEGRGGGKGGACLGRRIITVVGCHNHKFIDIVIFVSHRQQQYGSLTDYYFTIRKGLR